jgi:hypothetical protein
MSRAATLIALVAALVGVGLWLVLSGEEYAAEHGVSTISEAPDAVSDEGDPARKRVRAMAAPASEPEIEETTDPELRVVLRVLAAPDDTPVRGLRVEEVGGRGRAVTTDDEGRAVFPVLSSTAKLWLRAAAPGLDKGHEEVRVGETTVHVPPPIPLEVRFVDAETGGPPPPLEVWTDDDVVEGVFPGTAPARLAHSVWPGHPYHVELRASVTEPGWCSPTQLDLVREGRLCRYAERALITVPVPREAPVRVKVRDTARRPVAGATVSAWRSGARAEGTTGADGEAVLRGMPFQRGERLDVTAQFEGRVSEVKAPPLASPDAELVVELELPDDPPTDIGIGGGFGGRYSSRSSTRRRTPKEGTSSLVVQVLRRDGRPASGVRVGVKGPRSAGRTADDDGFIRIDGLPGGSYRVACTEHGLAQMVERLELAEGETRQVLLQEPAGRNLHLRVVDAQGRSLPGARIEISDATSHPWVPLIDGVQHLDTFSDGTGEVRAAHVPEGTIQVTAFYGSRKTKAVINEGEPLVVTIPDPPVPER